MSPSLNSGGYYVLGLRFKNKSKPKYIQVHIMVATVYNGGWHKGLVVDHLDGNKVNNVSSNLEWVTHAENAQRAYDTGLHRKYYGDDNANSKVSDKLVHSICDALMRGISVKECSNIFDVSTNYIHKLIENKSHTHITSQYPYMQKLRRDRNPLSYETKSDIMRLYNSNLPLKDIQKQLGVKSLNQVIHAIYDSRYRKD